MVPECSTSRGPDKPNPKKGIYQMTMLSQYFDYTEIGERTKLQLFDEANRQYINSLDLYNEDQDVTRFAENAIERLNEILNVFDILGIYGEYLISDPIDVKTALAEGITWQEAQAKRLIDTAWQEALKERTA